MAENWYFEENGEQVGPHSNAEIKEAVSQGRISADTLVWNEKMTDWTKASVAGLISFSSTPSTSSTESLKKSDDAIEVIDLADEQPYPLISQVSDEQTSADEEVTQCANCGGMFNSNDLVDIDGAPVCADCKPQYLRKLQEGGEVNNIYFLYAGFWIRFGAIFIDGIILNIVQIPISFVVTMTVAGIGAAIGSENTGITFPLISQIINMSINLTVAMLYAVFFLVKKGGTPGKLALGLRVINADGSKEITYGKAFGRFFAKMLSYLTFYIGFMMAGWDDEKRALHDRICATRVIYSK